MRSGIGWRLTVRFFMGIAAISCRMTMRTIRVMMVTARCSMVLLNQSRAAGSIHNGMQPRRTRWKEKLPENQQPCEILSAMRKHALSGPWRIEIKTPSPTSGPHCSCLYELSTEIARRFREFPYAQFKVFVTAREKQGFDHYPFRLRTFEFHS